MKCINETVDVVIAGGGTAGHIAALQAADKGGPAWLSRSARHPMHYCSQSRRISR